MKEPSEKQIKYARSIAHNLNVPLPKEYTAKAYYDFIAMHKNENRLATVDIDLISEVYSGILY